MGCDIHGHIELKIKGKWQHYSCPILRRCYPLFCRICGVRGPFDGIIPFSAPRGLPTDLSDITRICYERDKPDAHSMTWLDKHELNELIYWHEQYLETDSPGQGYTAQHHQWGYLTGNNFLQYPDSNPKEFEDCRFICWFDN